MERPLPADNRFPQPEPSANSPSGEDAGRATWRVWLRRSGWTLAAVVLWISLLRPPSVVPGVSLDDSWYAALGHLFKSGAQAGRDYVFTYGPLGFFMLPAYDADLFVAKFAWELTLKAIFTLIFFRFLTKQRSRVARALFYLTVVSLSPFAEDSLYTLVVLLVGVLLMKRPDAAIAVGASCALLLATLALAKFTLLLTGGLVTLSVALGWLVAGRWGRAGLLSASFLAGILVVWVLAGQSPANLLPFLRASWEMSTGYGEAMSIDGNPLEIVAALVILCLWAAAAISWRPWPVLRRQDVLAALLFLPAVYLYWKNGFIRHDEHAVLFFALVQPLTFVLPFALHGFDGRARWRVALLVTAGILSAACLRHATHLHPVPSGPWPNPLLNLREGASHLFDSSGVRRRLQERERSQRSTNALPRIRRIVGSEAVDSFGNQQGILLLNGMNWRQRPLFQSYTAYTPWLAEKNAAFFDRPEAPRYVLALLDPIDRRFPTLEDGLALLRILAHYRPVAAESSYLLLERVAAISPQSEVRKRADVRFGDIVRVEPSDRPQVLRLRFEKSWWGRLRGFLFKTPQVYLAVQAQDGWSRTFRIVPALCASGFLLNPLLMDTDDLIDAYAEGADPRRVVFCAVVTTPAGRACYRSIQVEVETLTAVTATRIGRAEALILRKQLGSVEDPSPRLSFSPAPCHRLAASARCPVCLSGLAERGRRYRREADTGGDAPDPISGARSLRRSSRSTSSSGWSRSSITCRGATSCAPGCSAGTAPRSPASSRRSGSKGTLRSGISSSTR